MPSPLLWGVVALGGAYVWSRYRSRDGDKRLRPKKPPRPEPQDEIVDSGDLDHPKLGRVNYTIRRRPDRPGFWAWFNYAGGSGGIGGGGPSVSYPSAPEAYEAMIEQIEFWDGPFE